MLCYKTMAYKKIKITLEYKITILKALTISNAV